MTLDPDPESFRETEYAQMETNDGTVVIYDQNEPNAWLLSDTTTDVSL